MRAVTLLTAAALLCCAFPATALPQQTTPPPQQDDNSKKQEKKVWTNDDLKRLPDTVTVIGQPAASTTPAQVNVTTPEKQNAANQNGSQQPYDQAQDPSWYQKQLAPLQQELQQIDQRLNAIRQGQKDGSGASGAVSLTNVPSGVDTQGAIEVLQKRRAQVAADIDDLESEARRNGVPPGDLRKELPPQESGTESAGGVEQQENEAQKNPEVVKAQKEIAAEQDHLERATKELDLFQRELNLDQQTVYSNPNYTTTGSGNSDLDEKRSQIGDKQTEIEQTEQKLQEMRDHLQDLERNPPAKESDNTQEAASTAEPAAKVEEESPESYWKKRFADLRAKIHLAETERDILQRELNVLQVQFDQDPQRAMIEQNTRQSINEHTDDVAAKDKEIADLKQQLADLEDELRKAGGEPGWARE
jgi:chromosome segregation ATPase